jgi:hypothetical protein
VISIDIDIMMRWMEKDAHDDGAVMDVVVCDHDGKNVEIQSSQDWLTCLIDHDEYDIKTILSMRRRRMKMKMMRIMMKMRMKMKMKMMMNHHLKHLRARAMSVSLSFLISWDRKTYIYIYIYIYMCVCVYNAGSSCSR